MKELGQARRILGIDIKRDRNKETLSLSQSGYIEKLIQIFGMKDAKPVSTPLGAHFNYLLDKILTLMKSSTRSPKFLIKVQWGA